MNRKRRSTWCLLVLLGGCSSEPRETGTAGDASLDQGAPRESGWGWTEPATDAATYAPTYYAVYYEILLPSCAHVFCHASDGYFTLATPELAYETLVGVPSSSPECASTGLFRVKPGTPDESLLYLKISGPPCGQAMPLQFGGSVRLEERKIEQVRAWIERGAPAMETEAGDR